MTAMTNGVSKFIKVIAVLLFMIVLVGSFVIGYLYKTEYGSFNWLLTAESLILGSIPPSILLGISDISNKLFIIGLKMDRLMPDEDEEETEPIEETESVEQTK